MGKKHKNKQKQAVQAKSVQPQTEKKEGVTYKDCVFSKKGNTCKLGVTYGKCDECQAYHD